MFGKPEWFRPKRFGWGLVPVTWYGWVYTAGATVFITLPFLFLLSISYVPEALSWIAISIAALCWDVAVILRAMKQQDRDNVQESDDIVPRASHVATRHFDLHLRR